MTNNGSFTRAIFALTKYPELLRYFEVEGKIQSLLPEVLSDRIFLDMKRIAPKDIEQLAIDSSSKHGGSHLMSFLSYILYDMIIFQKKDLIEIVLNTLTEKECTQLLWETPASVSLSFPLIFLACLVPYERHLNFSGHSKKEIVYGCSSILNLLLTKGGWNPNVGCSFNISFDKQKLADLCLPSDFFVNLDKEIGALEKKILGLKDQLSNADLNRFYLYVPPNEDFTQQLFTEDIRKDIVPWSLSQCKRYLEKKEQRVKFGLEQGFFDQLDKNIDSLKDQFEEYDITPSDNPIVQELDVLESLFVTRDFYMEKTCSTVKFSNLEDFLKFGNDRIFDSGESYDFHACTTNGALKIEECSIFSFTSVVPWTEYCDYLEKR